MTALQHTLDRRDAGQVQPRGALARLAAGGLAAAALALLGGCGLFGGGKPRYVPAELTNYPAKLTVSRAWSVSLGDDAGVGFAPTVVGNDVYAAASGGQVSKLDLSSGNVAWKISTKSDLSSGAGSDGKTVAVATPRGELIALDAGSGAVKWRVQVSSEVTIPPLVGEGLVVVRSGDYRVQAFDAETGRRRWNVQRPGPALALRAPAGLLLSQGYVFSGLPGGKIIAIATDSGAVRWEGTVANPSGTSELERVADVVGTPVITGRQLCAVTYQGRIGCFDVGSGNQTWSRAYSSTSGLAADARFAYAATDHGSVSGFALESGSNVWKQDALANRGLSAPAISGRTLAVGDYKGYVHFLSREDGTLLARIATDGSPIVAQLVSTDRGVLVQTSEGHLALIAVPQ